MDTAQEIIIHFQQTIEKFHKLVKNQLATMEELQQKARGPTANNTNSYVVLSLNCQLKSTSMKAPSKVSILYSLVYSTVARWCSGIHERLPKIIFCAFY